MGKRWSAFRRGATPGTMRSRHPNDKIVRRQEGMQIYCIIIGSIIAAITGTALQES